MDRDSVGSVGSAGSVGENEKLESLKARWVLCYVTLRQALKMGRRQVADRQWEAWNGADEMVRAALTEGEYDDFRRGHEPEGGIWLPELGTAVGVARHLKGG